MFVAFVWLFSLLLLLLIRFVSCKQIKNKLNLVKKKFRKEKMNRVIKKRVVVERK
mgnify:CR=1 FL=1